MEKAKLVCSIVDSWNDDDDGGVRVVHDVDVVVLDVFVPPLIEFV